MSNVYREPTPPNDEPKPAPTPSPIPRARRRSVAMGVAWAGFVFALAAFFDHASPGPAVGMASFAVTLFFTVGTVLAIVITMNEAANEQHLIDMQRERDAVRDAEGRCRTCGRRVDAP